MRPGHLFDGIDPKIVIAHNKLDRLARNGLAHAELFKRARKGGASMDLLFQSILRLGDRKWSYTTVCAWSAFLNYKDERVMKQSDLLLKSIQDIHQVIMLLISILI